MKEKKMLYFTVLGPPQGKARARTFYNSKLGKMQSITPDNTILYENLIKVAYNSVSTHIWDDNQPLEMTISAYYEIPKSASKKSKQLMLENVIRPTKKPDIDNIAKVVCDALNGLAYRDDKQVVLLRLSKLYGENPRIEVTIQEL